MVSEGVPTAALWRGRRIHLVGIGGFGMSALAQVLQGRGAVVSGSDMRASPLTEKLESLDIEFHLGHRPDNVRGKDLVVASSAIPQDNEELVAARELDIPVWGRPQLLRELSQEYRVIAIAGTHGKTTTTSMLGWVLTQAGYDPTVIAGGVMQDFDSNARVGKGAWLVVEADEYDRTFLAFSPEVAVVTNIEFDHPDCFADMAAMEGAFREFLQGIRPGGLFLGCGEDGRVRALAEGVRLGGGGLVQLYGREEGCGWQARHIESGSGGGIRYDVLHEDQYWGRAELRLAGFHNALNSLAALAVACHLGARKEAIIGALACFSGVGRRFEVLGEARGVTIVDDYAHHPTEVRATLAAARAKYPGKRLWAVFQPHTFSRIQALLGELREAFREADELIITDIFASREVAGPGSITGAALAKAIAQPEARYIGDLGEVVSYLMTQVKPNDVVITMNAGDGRAIAEGLLKALKEGG